MIMLRVLAVFETVIAIKGTTGPYFELTVSCLIVTINCREWTTQFDLNLPRPYEYIPTWSGPDRTRTVQILIWSGTGILSINWKTDRIGLHYRGKLNRTVSGRICQPWVSNKPHSHGYGYLKDDENFCRNPDLVYPGPWCFTMDPNIRWEFCPLYKCGSFCSEGFFKCNNGKCIITYQQCNGEPDCSDGEDELNCEQEAKECKEERSGVTYRGKLNISKTGKNCMPWISMYTSIFGNNNYCRSTTGWLKNEGPVCYTKPGSKKQELCNLQKCDINSFRDLDYFKEKFECNKILSTTLSTTDQDNQHDSSSCLCPCKHPGPVVLTSADIESIKRDIELKLSIKKQYTSMYRRTKSCAPDERVSSFSIGIVGVTILVCVTSFVVMLDCLPNPKN